MNAFAANEERLARLRSTMTKLGLVTFFLLQIEVAVSLRGRRAELAWLLSFCLVGALLNVVVNGSVARIGSRLAERLRAAGNLVFLVAICHLSGWALPGIVMFVIVGAVEGATGGPDAVWLSVIVALVGAAACALDGSGLLIAFTLATAVAGAFCLVYCSARVGIDLMEQLDARHRDLASAHAQLEKMQQVAVQQEKLAGLGLMAAGIAHEINNPMSVVTSNVISLLADMRTSRELPDELQEYVDDVLPDTVDGIRRVNAIVSDLRRFARGDGAGSSEPYDLRQQVEHALRLANNQLKQKCTVKLELGEVPELRGRPQQITQVLVNLLVNAAQAITREGTVTVVTRRSCDDAILEVKDTGSGMTPETLRRLFEPFFSTKPAGEGTGLGLAVIHGIVKEHGGAHRRHEHSGKGQLLHRFIADQNAAR